MPTKRPKPSGIGLPGPTLTLAGLFLLLFLLLLLSHDIGVTLLALLVGQAVLFLGLIAASLLLLVSLPSQFALIATSHFSVRKL